MSLQTYSQNATVIYNGSSLSNINSCPQCCNVFNQSGNNPSVGGLVHWPVSGGATFDGTNINMQTRLAPFANPETDVNKVFLGIGFQIHLESNKN